MAAGCFPSFPAVPTTISNIFNTKLKLPPYDSYLLTSRKKLLGHPSNINRCKATSSSSQSSSYYNYSSITEWDLYDLLGIDSCSDQSHIKMAYRTLQKRCHPDIAGPAGHDMAIILNQAYKLLSDPTSRSAYDKEQAKISELRGFSGKPIYSVWLGPQSEQRAVFVDEVKCVGCLKCALFAKKTFAVESVYGRARVVAQWADPEDKIQAAIDACPVDCISMVERSDLAALEFLMSKQPRGNVRVGAGNSVGARVSNIFIDVKKFQTRYAEEMNKADTSSSKETDLQREARMAAIQAIRSISNWLYWQSPKPGAPTSGFLQNVPQDSLSSAEPNIDKLREAAAARKRASKSTGPMRRSPSNFMVHEEYWVPSTHALPESINTSKTKATRKTEKLGDATERDEYREREYNRQNPIRLGFPMVTATFAAITTRIHAGGGGVVSGLNEHVGGSLALEIVNSFWLQTALAAVTWYFIGVTVTELVETLGHKE